MKYTEAEVNEKLREMRGQELPCNVNFDEGGWEFSSATNIVSAVQRPQNPVDSPITGRMATLPQRGWEFGRDAEKAEFIDYTFSPKSWHCLSCGFPEDPAGRVQNCCSSCGMEQK